MKKVKKTCHILSVKYISIKRSEKEKIDSYFFHRRWIGVANIRHFATLLKLKKMSSRQLYAFYPKVFIDNEKYQKDKLAMVWPYHKKRVQFFLKYEIMSIEVKNHIEIVRKLIKKKRNFYNKNDDFNWYLNV